MKTTYPRTSSGPAFTLLELLVVIAIIGLLASLIFPVLRSARVQAKTSIARTDMANLRAAISAYQADYGRLPSPSAAYQAAAPDFTYGTGSLTNGSGYEAGNREIVAILMGVAQSRDAAPTANTNHLLNPRRFAYFNAKAATTDQGNGIGPDGVLRDPWGNPYIITLDLDFDGRCHDTLYRRPMVSAGPGGVGYAGLSHDPSSPAEGYFLLESAMIWSFGPDGMADPALPANVPPNTDNVLGWQ